MPLWGHLFESRRDGGGGQASETRSSSSRGAAGATNASAPDQPRTAPDLGQADEDAIDDGPLHKLTAAYHRSLEGTSVNGGSEETVSRDARQAAALASGRYLVVREQQDGDRPPRSHTLHATESRETSRNESSSAPEQSLSTGEAQYDLGLDDGYDLCDNDYELVGLSGCTRRSDDGETADPGQGGSSTRRLRDKPLMLLRTLTKSGNDKRRHILSPQSSSRGGGGSGGSVGSGDVTSSDCEDDGTGSEFRDALELAAQRAEHGTPSPASSAASIGEDFPASICEPRFRRVDLSIASHGGGGGGGGAVPSLDGAHSEMDGGDDELYAMEVAAEVAVVRLDDEFYTSSELAQWRRLQCDRVGAGFVSASPTTVATTSEGSFPSSLCNRATATSSTSGNGEAVMVVRTASDYGSHSKTPSDLSEGTLGAITQSHIRHVFPATARCGQARERKRDDHAAPSATRNMDAAHTAVSPKPRTAPAAATTPTSIAGGGRGGGASPLTSPHTTTASRWGGVAKMEDAKMRYSETSECGLTRTLTNNSVVCVAHQSAACTPQSQPNPSPQQQPPPPPPAVSQRRLSRPNGKEQRASH